MGCGLPIRLARLAQEQVAFQEMDAGEMDTSAVALYPPMTTYDDTTLYEGIATEWANASIMMGTALQHTGTPHGEIGAD